MHAPHLHKGRWDGPEEEQDGDYGPRNGAPCGELNALDVEPVPIDVLTPAESEHFPPAQLLAVLARPRGGLG